MLSVGHAEAEAATTAQSSTTRPRALPEILGKEQAEGYQGLEQGPVSDIKHGQAGALRGEEQSRKCC